MKNKTDTVEICPHCKKVRCKIAPILDSLCNYDCAGSIEAGLRPLAIPTKKEWETILREDMERWFFLGHGTRIRSADVLMDRWGNRDALMTQLKKTGYKEGLAYTAAESICADYSDAEDFEAGFHAWQQREFSPLP